MLPDVGGHALQLQGLETSPAEQVCMRRGEFTKAADNIIADARPYKLLLRRDRLISRVLAYWLV